MRRAREHARFWGYDIVAERYTEGQHEEADEFIWPAFELQDFDPRDIGR